MDLRVLVISGIALLLMSRYILFLVFIIFIVLAFHLLAVFWIKAPQRLKKTPLSAKHPRLSFTKCDKWVEEVENLESERKVREKLEESAYGPTLSVLEDFIIRDFVKPWYDSISSDDTFPNEVESQLNSIIASLEDKLKNVDVSGLLVLKILPVLTNHFQTYLRARDVVLDDVKKLDDSALGVSELNAKIVREFRSANDINGFISEHDVDDLESGMRSYSRNEVKRIIPYLVSREELDSGAVQVIIEELLSQVIFAPVLRLLSDPDFWNGIIIKYATITLKDRDQVRELKKIIDQQTSRSANNTVLQNKISSKGRRISLQMRQQEFENYLKNIETIESLSQLKQLRYFIALQINRSQNLKSTSDRFLEYRKRLNIAKEKIEAQIAEISLKIPTDPNTQKRNSLIFNHDSDIEGFIHNLSLFQVLSNASALPFFEEFMKKRERVDLLNFWIAVNEIKDPLEDPRTDADEDQVLEEMSSSTTELNIEDISDIKRIFDNFFQKKVLRFDQKTYDQVFEFCNSKDKTFEEYSRIRKLIIFQQIRTFKEMERLDFGDFKNSDYFLKLLSSEKFEESLISEVDNLEDYVDSDMESDLEQSQGESLLEIENALNTILTKPDSTKYEERSAVSLGKAAGSNGSTEKLKDQLFGSQDDPFLGEKPLFEEEKTLNPSILRNDELSDTLEIQNDFIEPTHDTFNLKEEIISVTSEIAKLYKQSSMLDPLILKAELMNNSQELRLLRKSKTSYEREIESKELIKQQLIVQDNENSLYGKTRVCINSWVKGKDEQNGRDHIIYLIEIEKSSTIPREATTTSNWVIGRRFNQFWALNDYLKKTHPSSLNGITLPKKKIVLRFQEKSIIDERRVQLEIYLKRLLGKPDICQDKEFRKFLTLEYHQAQTFSASKTHSTTSPIAKHKDKANMLYNPSVELLRSPRSSKRDFLQSSKDLGFTDLEYHSDPFPSSIRNNSKSSSVPFDKTSVTESAGNSKSTTATTNIMQSNLMIDSNTSFVKPITELFTTLFPLSNQTNNWLRGQAIVLILQQIFGSTIEKHIKSMIFQMTAVQKVKEIFDMLKDILWPNGKFMTRGKAETENNDRQLMKEKIKRFQDSKVLLNKLMRDVFGKIVGDKSCEMTGGKIHAMIQLNALNLELIINVFDLIVQEIFKENDGKATK